MSVRPDPKTIGERFAKIERRLRILERLASRFNDPQVALDAADAADEAVSVLDEDDPTRVAVEALSAAVRSLAS